MYLKIHFYTCEDRNLKLKSNIFWIFKFWLVWNELIQIILDMIYVCYLCLHCYSVSIFWFMTERDLYDLCMHLHYMISFKHSLLNLHAFLVDFEYNKLSFLQIYIFEFIYHFVTFFIYIKLVSQMYHYTYNLTLIISLCISYFPSFRPAINLSCNVNFSKK